MPPSATLHLLGPLETFYAAAGVVPPAVELVTVAEVPSGPRRLLAVAGPLTPRLEHHHGGSLTLRVLERRRGGDVYARRIVLVRGDGVPVVLGAIEVDLTRLTPAARVEVLRERLPFGHVLGDARGHPEAFLRVRPDPLIAAALAITADGEPLYGRRRTVLGAGGAVVATVVELLAPERTPSPIRRDGCRASA
jgi:chorismate-pyruvate lyase